jgi:hypothetical protein
VAFSPGGDAVDGPIEQEHGRAGIISAHINVGDSNATDE